MKVHVGTRGNELADQLHEGVVPTRLYKAMGEGILGIEVILNGEAIVHFAIDLML